MERLSLPIQRRVSFLVSSPLSAPTCSNPWTTFVQSHLEYAEFAWSPTYRSLENKTASPAKRLLDGLGCLDHPQCLGHLNLTMLKHRRPVDRPSGRHNTQLFQHTDGMCSVHHWGDKTQMWKNFNVYEREILCLSGRHNTVPVMECAVSTQELLPWECQWVEWFPVWGCCSCVSEHLYNMSGSPLD